MRIFTRNKKNDNLKQVNNEIGELFRFVNAFFAHIFRYVFMLLLLAEELFNYMSVIELILEMY